MDIMEWKKEIVNARRKKFSKDDSPQDCLLAMLRQVGDVGELIQVEQGVRQQAKAHKTIQSAIACILVDFFKLCELYNVDLEKELEEIKQWFLTSKEKR